jgi:SAM-dependent methyltransferase
MVFSGSSEGYDRFMGRYSQQLAAPFADFAGLSAGMRALDVGAGTGALTAELVARLGGGVAAAEPSPDFVHTLRERFPGLDVREASAEALPWADGSFDAVLSQLVITFLADPPAGAREQKRVARPGGVVAACMWERDAIEVMTVLRAVQAELIPDALSDEGPGRHYRTEDELRALFLGVGLEDVSTTMIAVQSTYASFGEFWDVARASAGPGSRAARAAAEWSPEQVARARAIAFDALGSPSDSFTLGARCVCARGLA